MANALPLLFAGGAAFLLMGGKKKKRKNGSSEDQCPAEITLDFGKLEYEVTVVEDDGGTTEVRTPKIVVDLARGGNKSIVSLTTKLFATQVPSRCLTNERVQIRIIRPYVDDDNPGGEYSADAPSMFFYGGSSLMEDLVQMKLWGPQEAVQARADLVNWWNKHMPGEPFPSD